MAKRTARTTTTDEPDAPKKTARKTSAAAKAPVKTKTSAKKAAVKKAKAAPKAEPERKAAPKKSAKDKAEKAPKEKPKKTAKKKTAEDDAVKPPKKTASAKAPAKKKATTKKPAKKKVAKAEKKAGKKIEEKKASTKKSAGKKSVEKKEKKTPAKKSAGKKFGKKAATRKAKAPEPEIAPGISEVSITPAPHAGAAIPAAEKKSEKKSSRKEEEKVSRKSGKKSGPGRKASQQIEVPASVALTPEAPAPMPVIVPRRAEMKKARAMNGTKGASDRPWLRHLEPRAPEPPPPPPTGKSLLPPSHVAPELPTEYGRTMISAMVRDPERLFVYWEVSPEERRRLGLDAPGRENPLRIRLRDLSDLADGHEFEVTDPVSSRYVEVPHAGRRYLLELGLVGGQKAFRVIASSGPVDVPAPAVSGRHPKEFDDVDPDTIQQVLKLSGGVHLANDRPSSDQFLTVLPQQLFSLRSGSGMTSPMGPLSRPALPQQRRRPGDGNQFWLEVGVDVIVYGRTEPDARVRFMGRNIRLTPDGRFRFRFTLPDGSLEFPVEGTSADGEHTIAVKPVVNRRTF